MVKKEEPKPDKPITIEYKDMFQSNLTNTTLINPDLKSIVLYNGKNSGLIYIIKTHNPNKKQLISTFKAVWVHPSVKNIIDTIYCS